MIFYRECIYGNGFHKICEGRRTHKNKPIDNYPHYQTQKAYNGNVFLYRLARVTGVHPTTLRYCCKDLLPIVEEMIK